MAFWHEGIFKVIITSYRNNPQSENCCNIRLIYVCSTQMVHKRHTCNRMP